MSRFGLEARAGAVKGGRRVAKSGCAGEGGGAAAGAASHGCALKVVPPARAWRGMLKQRKDERSVRFRRELGLPVDAPIVMTGHQAEFWHPGIAAKYIAADVFSGAAGARCAWVVVDQEPQEAAVMRYPARGAKGRLVVRAREYGAAEVAGAGAGSHDELIAPVRDGLGRIDAAFAAFEDERLAARVAKATGELLRRWLKHEVEPAMVFATELWRTTLMGELVARMQREPERVCAAYNAAARRHAGAGIRELLVNEVQDVYELPLWRMRADGWRERVYAEMLDSVPREELAPRALLMTALLRLAGCDLFIHGMGGAGEEQGREGYDRVMEEWLGEWLGVAAEELAPAMMVTATLRLPLMEGSAPTRDEIARAVWLAHHARHDPAVVGEQARAAEKRRQVEAIASVPRERKAERAERFDALQVFLEEYREACRGELLRLASAAEELKRRAEDAEIAGDRAWAFAMYPAAEMDALRGEIEGAFA